MVRIFIADITEPSLRIKGEDYKHLVQVLRAKPGDPIEVVANEKTYIATILEVTDDGLVLGNLVYCEDTSESPIDIHLYQAVTKGDKMDYILQKAVELGVRQITPILTKRVIVRMDQKKMAQRVLRWQKIVNEAAKQSKRTQIPVVTDVMSLMEINPGEGRRLVAYENSKTSLRETLQNGDEKKYHLCIGPEGGFEELEIQWLIDHEFEEVSLGPRILRTETAGLALLSILQYEKGDMGSLS